MKRYRYIPVSNRDTSSLLVPSVKSRSLEQLISTYMMTGDQSGFASNDADSFDFDDMDHIDLDCELPQSMNKIDAILHFRNIRDNLRSPMQFEKSLNKETSKDETSSVEVINSTSAESTKGD